MLDKLTLYRIKNNFPSHKIDDLQKAVRDELDKAWPKTAIKPGQSVAITVGSRGISNLAEITTYICDGLRRIGARPVIIPAMGSHGGATPEGQKRVLADYGVTQERTGAVIDTRMEVEKVGVSPEGMNVYLAKSALEADHTIVFNRVKPHTDFKGDIESGLCKIMAIGLGKRAGASYYHRSIIDLGFAKALESAGKYVLKNSNVAFGLAVVEDAYDHSSIVKHLMPDELVEEEKKLLVTAKSYMASLPFKKADVLVIDLIGKNISGTCMDTNITGRFQNIYTPHDLDEPKIKRIYVRDITEESHGNFCGLGRADFINKRLFDKLDFEATYINCITGLGMENGRVPIVRKNDAEAFDALNITIGHVPPQELKLIWIRDTLALSETVVSEAFLKQVQQRSDLDVIDKFTPQFGETGYLTSPWGI
jgi:hypothetical protein